MRGISIPVSPKMVADFCRTTGDDCIMFNIEGVPKDAELMGVYYDHVTRMFMVNFTHDSFVDVLDGCPFPVKYITHTKYYI